MIADFDSVAWPLADGGLEQELLDLVQQSQREFRGLPSPDWNLTVPGETDSVLTKRHRSRLPPAQEGSERGHQDAQPRHLGARRPRCRLRPPRHPPAHPFVGRGQVR